MNRLAARARFTLNTTPLMLASVTSPEEARVCLNAGADLIDAKDPKTGALGALPSATVAAIVSEIKTDRAQRTTLVSATIGDLPMAPEAIRRATADMALAGVDYVKIGLRSDGDRRAAISSHAGCELGNAQLVGVLFADQDPDFGLIDIMADAGFAGAMLDTFDKKAGSIRRIFNVGRLSEFIVRAQKNSLFAGLAGSLRAQDVDALAPLGPNILGFRGALCLDSDRTFAIDERAVAGVRSRLDAVHAAGSRAVG